MGSRNHSRKKHQSQPRKDQVPHKFAVDERVLCYEPDLKKARVLYDSKVLEVVERSDKGKIRVEYKIHFFGWNSSWDRYVAEDCVLKDTDENRNLQKELKSKADVLIQSHLKKKKRKKTLTEILKEVTKDKTGKGTKDGTKNDDDSSNSSGSSDSSDQESSDDEDRPAARIYLTDRVKALLEQDYYNVMMKNMLVRIPAEVSVICVFEGYVKFIGFRELRKVIENYKPFFIASGLQPITSTTTLGNFGSSSANTKTSGANNKYNSSELLTEDVESIYKKVRQAQEIVHGLKIIFDYMLYQMLLYNVENDQYKSHRGMRPRMPDINCSQLIPQLPIPGVSTGEEVADIKKKQQKKIDHEGDGPSTSTKHNKPVPGTSREQNSETLNKLRKHTKTKAEDPMKCHISSSNLLTKAGYEAWLKSVNKYINELKSWQMLPEECYQKEHPDPSMVYGLIHLLRFFVKLPEILTLMRIPRRKVLIIAHHVNQMMDHIQSSYVFSISRLYVSLPRYVYEEDQIRLAPPAAEDDKQTEVKVDRDKNWSQFCTRYHRSVVIERIKPPLAKVVEVPLSSSAGDALQEHQLTIRTEARLQFNSGPNARDGKSGNSNPKPSTSRMEASKPIVKSSAPTTDKHQETVIKEEPVSPPLPPARSAVQNQKKPTPKTTTVTPTRSASEHIMVRQVRKSAAHAAFKTAHMFASQQALTSRTIAASNLIKKEPEDEPTTSKKRSLPSDTAVSDSKRVTRTNDTTSSNAPSTPSKGSNVRKSREELTPNALQTRKGSFRSPMGRRSSDSPTRKSKESKPSSGDDNGKNTRQHRLSGTRLSPNRSKETEREKRNSSSPDKSKTEAKKVSSPRNSRSSSSNKDGRSSSKTPQKSTSPTSTIRLRSRSDERQLRSKGALINALSLSMQGTPRSSHSHRSEEGSPRRRDSTGNRDCGNNSQVTTRHSEPMQNRRTSRR